MSWHDAPARVTMPNESGRPQLLPCALKSTTMCGEIPSDFAPLLVSQSRKGRSHHAKSPPGRGACLCPGHPSGGPFCRPAAEDSLCFQPQRQPRDLLDECRWYGRQEPDRVQDQQHGPGLGARRQADCLHFGSQWHQGHLRDGRRRQERQAADQGQWREPHSHLFARWQEDPVRHQPRRQLRSLCHGRRRLQPEEPDQRRIV